MPSLRVALVRARQQPQRRRARRWRSAPAACASSVETRLTTPAVAPADVVFGLGRAQHGRRRARAVAVRHPAGEIDAAGEGSDDDRRARSQASSCPFLFTWNGERFEFITDFLGGGEMGYWVGPGDGTRPIRTSTCGFAATSCRRATAATSCGHQRARGGAVPRSRSRCWPSTIRPTSTCIPNEGLRTPPRPPFKLYATRRRARAAARRRRARARRTRRDRRARSSLARRLRAAADSRLRRAAHAHARSRRRRRIGAVLLLTGWTDYAFSTDNVAAPQARTVDAAAVAAGARRRRGAGRRSIEDIGFPVGRPQTVVVDLTGKWLGAVARGADVDDACAIYWDQILVDTSGGDAARQDDDARSGAARICAGAGSRRRSARRPRALRLRLRHASRRRRRGRRCPGATRAKATCGRCWPRTDDMFVVARPGDEIALSFDAAARRRCPPAGRARSCSTPTASARRWTSARPARTALGPLPFHAMTTYPYGAGEHYPDGRRIARTSNATTRVWSRGRCRHSTSRSSRPQRARGKTRSMTLRYSAAACQTDFANPLDRAPDAREHRSHARDDRRGRRRQRAVPAGAPGRVSGVRARGAGLSDRRASCSTSSRCRFPTSTPIGSSARRASTTSTSRAGR